MFDIITFGSATRDTFLRLKKGSYRVLEEEEPSESKSLCFGLGAKIFIEDLKVASGGGATNTAVTFANQGLRTAVFTKVGSDKRGEAVIEELRRFKVNTQLIEKDEDYPTAYSAILSLSGERTILLYRGACHLLTERDIPFSKLRTKWFYLAPLSGKSAEVFVPLVKFAKKQGIKIAANLGNSQIELREEILAPQLKEIDVLILNKEEASLLSQIKKEKGREIIKKLKSSLKGILVITKGKEGSMVSDGKYVFTAGIPQVLPFEKTGAGDAFASGFLSGLLKKNDIEYAVQLATANSTSCIQKIGAKNGLLKKEQWGSWPKVKVEKRAL